MAVSFSRQSGHPRVDAGGLGRVRLQHPATGRRIHNGPSGSSRPLIGSIADTLSCQSHDRTRKTGGLDKVPGGDRRDRTTAFAGEEAHVIPPQNSRMDPIDAKRSDTALLPSWGWGFPMSRNGPRGEPTGVSSEHPGRVLWIPPGPWSSGRQDSRATRGLFAYGFNRDRTSLRARGRPE